MVMEPAFTTLVVCAAGPVTEQRGYTALLFHGAVRAIPAGQWQSCAALGMNRRDQFGFCCHMRLTRVSSYSNEVGAGV